VRAGAKLSAADKEKLKAYNGEIASLQSTFSQNVLKEANASALVVDTREELAGLSDAEITPPPPKRRSAAWTASTSIALANTTGQPPLAHLTNRAVRERLMAASMAPRQRGGEFDTRELVLKLAKLRAERATLLGYPNYAAYSQELKPRRTRPPSTSCWPNWPSRPSATRKKEAAEMQKMSTPRKGGFQIAAHDWAFYTDKVRAAQVQLRRETSCAPTSN
jgi:peptidyl-dipeptidase Dcp